MIHRHTVLRMIDGKPTPKRVYDTVYEFPYQGDMYEVCIDLTEGFPYIHQKNGKSIKKQPSLEDPFWQAFCDWYNRGRK